MLTKKIKKEGINTIAHVGLSYSLIEYTGFRKILLGCHIPALNVSSLQKIRANNL
jgi:hypothetical protein